MWRLQMMTNLWGVRNTIYVFNRERGQYLLNTRILCVIIVQTLKSGTPIPYVLKLWDVIKMC